MASFLIVPVSAHHVVITATKISCLTDFDGPSGGCTLLPVPARVLTRDKPIPIFLYWSTSSYMLTTLTFTLTANLLIFREKQLVLNFTGTSTFIPGFICSPCAGLVSWTPGQVGEYTLVITTTTSTPLIPQAVVHGSTMVVPH